MRSLLFIIPAALLLSGCASTGVNLRPTSVEGSQAEDMIREKIYQAESALEKGEIILCRQISDRTLVKLIENKKTFSDQTYERLHGGLALLRLKTAHSHRERAEVIESDLFPLIYNARVEKWKNYYTTRGREHFSRYLQRAAVYMEEVKGMLVEERLPADLAYVVIIESGYYPFARSSAGAVGLWQFMEGTAKMKGLTIDYWIDERRDPGKSTRAAACYLRDLYEEFGTWEMALAAYNYGPTAVRRNIRRWNTNDYWEIYLPRETEEFVPKIMAAIFIAKEPEVFGFESIENNPLNYKKYTLKGAVDLRDIASMSGTDIRELQLLNPELRRMATPPVSEYNIRIPEENYEKFVKSFEALPALKAYLSEEEINRRIRRVEYYNVRRGDNLWAVSRRYNVSVEQIKQWNNLSSARIYPNQRLRLYIRGS